MKKFLLSAMALVATMSANAQVFQMDAEVQGLTSDLSDVEAGKAWGSIEGALQISNAFATQHKAVDCKNNDYTKVIIDGNEILTKGGVQGNDNPKDADGTGVGASLAAPVSGAVIALTAEKDGWVYIVSKLSTNKQYAVFEEGLPIGYKIAMENADARVTNGVLTVEFKGEGEFNNLSKEMDEYKDGLPWVIRKYLNEPEAESAGNGLGVFYFPVAAGCKYYASASGSKISWCGIYFSETEAQSVKVEGEGISKTLVGEGGSVIPPVEEKVYSVIGTLVGNWDVDTDMKLEDGLYTVLFENIAAGSYEWKIRQDHDWAINWGDNGDGTGVQDGPNFKSELPEGSSMKILFNPATAEINVQVAGGAIVPPVENNVIWEGPMVFDGWGVSFVIEADKFANVQAGDIIRANYSDKGADFNPIYKHVDDWSDWTDFQNAINKDNDGYIEAPVTEAAIAELQSKGLRFQGVGFTMTSVELLPSTAINNVKKAINADGAIFNAAGQRVNASYRGLVIKNGKKFIQK